MPRRPHGARSRIAPRRPQPLQAWTAGLGRRRARGAADSFQHCHRAHRVRYAQTRSRRRCGAPALIEGVSIRSAAGAGALPRGVFAEAVSRSSVCGPPRCRRGPRGRRVRSVGGGCRRDRRRRPTRGCRTSSPLQDTDHTDTGRDTAGLARHDTCQGPRTSTAGVDLPLRDASVAHRSESPRPDAHAARVPRGQQPFRRRPFQRTVGDGKFDIPSSTKIDPTFNSTGTDTDTDILTGPYVQRDGRGRSYRLIVNGIFARCSRPRALSW